MTSSPAGINCGTVCTTQQGTFTTGSSVTLTATAGPGAAFAGWSGGGCGGTGTCIVTMSANITVIATFNATSYTLSVNKPGTGSGTVTSSPAGINCGATCSASFSAGAVVTLTATPATGTTFTSWSGGGCSGSGTCIVTMNAATSVTATFTINTYLLTVSPAGTGSGTVTSSPAGINCGVTCSSSFNYNTVVTLTATAGGGSAFTGWSGGGCSGTGTCIVTMTAVTGVTATFDTNLFTLDVGKSGAGTGTVTSSPAGINCGVTCSFNFTTGTVVTLTATPAGGSTFAGWSGSGCSGTGTCIVTMSAARSVTADFAISPHSVTVTPAGTGTGVVSSAPVGITCPGTCGSSFSGGSSVNLSAVADAGSTFTGWSGDCSGTGACNLTMTAEHAVTATFTLIPRTLTVTKNGSGSGSVSSSPAGISCGATCSTQFANGTSVDLTATADPGSTFAGWSGACTGTGICTVTMDQKQGVTATFVLLARTLTVSPAGTGSGTVTSSPSGINCGGTCTRIYDDGTSVTLTAAAAAGSDFTGWSGSGCSGTGTCTLTMNADKSVTATYTLQTKSLTITKDGTGTGTITSAPSGITCGATCAASFDYGVVATLSASPTPGSTFAGWSGDCAAFGVGPCPLTMNSNNTITATFVLIPRTLTVVPAGTGTGTVTSNPVGINCGSTCDRIFGDGTSVILTATPDAGTSFAGWSGGGCGGTGTCTLAMTADRSVTATFTLIPRTVSVSKDGGGSGIVSSAPAGISCGATCSSQFNDGTSVTLTATTSPGSTFAGWTGACSGTGLCILSMDQDRAVTATFVLIPRTLAVTPAGTGSGTVTSLPTGIDCGSTCDRIFEDGTSVILVATPDAGTTFTGWSGSGCSGSGTCSLTMGADRAVTATFTLIPRTLSVSKSGVGTGSVSSSPSGISCGATCSHQYDDGTSVDLTATADPGSTFAGWSGACTGVGVCSLTMEQNEGVTATFVLVPRTLTITRAGAGSGTVTSSPVGVDCGNACVRIFNDGTSVTLSAVADTGSTFSGWSGSGCSGTAQCTIAMTNDKAVTATFTLQSKSLSVTTSGVGTGTVTSSPAGIACSTSCSTSFTFGTSVVLSASPTTGSTFAGWTGDCAAFGTGPCLLSMDAIKNVSASFVTAAQTLTVAKAGTGDGDVTSSVAGIACGATCAFIYQNGTSVTLTATPDVDSSFTGWSGSGCSGTGTCVVSMSTDRAVTATFAAASRTLTVTKSGGGTGTVASVPGGISCGVTCAAGFNSGSEVVLLAAPAAGSVFLGWSGGGCSGTGLCSMTISTDTTVEAVFAGPRQPDGSVKTSKAVTYTGENILNITGVGQTVRGGIKPGKKGTFSIKLTNAGAQADTFTMLSNKGKQKPFGLKYFSGSTDITTAVIAGTYTTASLSPGQNVVITAKVKAARTAKKRTLKSWLLTSTSVTDPTEQDTIGFQAKVR